MVNASHMDDVVVGSKVDPVNLVDDIALESTRTGLI